MKENIWISRKNEFDSDEVAVKVVESERSSLGSGTRGSGRSACESACLVRGFLGDSDGCKGASTILVVDYCS